MAPNFDSTPEQEKLVVLLNQELQSRVIFDSAPRQIVVTESLAKKLSGSRFLPPEGTVTLLVGDPALIIDFENAFTTADASALKHLEKVIDALLLAGPPTSRDANAMKDVNAAFKDLIAAPSLFEFYAGKNLLANYLALSSAKLLAKAFPFASDNAAQLDFSLRERFTAGRRVAVASVVVVRPMQLSDLERAANTLLPADSKIAGGGETNMIPTAVAVATMFARMAVVAAVAWYTGYNTAAKADSDSARLRELTPPPDRELSVAELLEWRRSSAPRLFS